MAIDDGRSEAVPDEQLSSSSSTEEHPIQNHQQQQNRHHQQQSRRRSSRRIIHKKSGYSPMRTASLNLYELAGGISIYAICVSLPTVLGVIVRFYLSFHEMFVPKELYPTYPSSSNSHGASSSSSTTSIADSDSYIKNISQMPNQIMQFLHEKAWSYIETKALSDVQFLILLSISMALFRVFLTYLLVPKSVAPTLSRVQSTHLLSSREYQFNNNSNTSLPRRGSIETMATDALHFISAPRSATAIFRLCVCFVSCTWAYREFHEANFWPVWVGGHKTAQTKNCWDLSGSVAFRGGLEIDSDFDNQNSALRIFFLSQASYQLHSLGFHTLSMTLAFLSSNHGEGYTFVKALVKSYIRPLFEHLLYLTLILGSFIFSAQRRLAAIAIFSLEASSLFLQILQICINASETSILQRPTTIKFVHRALVVPVFIYFRLFVLPFIVLYSAAFESSDWIRQIERATTHGCGLTLYFFFNGLLILACGLNFMLLRRLLFHPHVTQIIASKSS